MDGNVIGRRYVKTCRVSKNNNQGQNLDKATHPMWSITDK